MGDSDFGRFFLNIRHRRFCYVSLEKRGVFFKIKFQKRKDLWNVFSIKSGIDQIETRTVSRKEMEIFFKK